jgi:hypothetical protein
MTDGVNNGGSFDGTSCRVYGMTFTSPVEGAIEISGNGVADGAFSYTAGA